MSRGRPWPVRGRFAARLAVAFTVSTAMFAGPPVSAPAFAAPPGPPPLAHTKATPVVPVASHYTKPAPMPSWKPTATHWPAGSADVAVPAADTAHTPPAAVQAGQLPVWIEPRSVAGKPAASGTVHVALATDQQAAQLGVNGVMLSLAADDTRSGGSAARVSLSYAQFEHAFGADWASRLGFVAYPSCALSTPALAGCRTATPVTYTNDARTRTLRADVVLPARTGGAAPALLLAATSTNESGGGGDFTATSLKPSGTWQSGGSSDSFAWSYPIAVPSVPGGLAPSVTLAYNSQSQDGLTSSTNNQPSWIGDGWDYSPGFIERSYASCHDNPAGSTRTWDSCWSASNGLTMSLNGSSSPLVKDDATGTYHPQNDSNERVEFLSGATNGAHGGEYWRITTADGTQYYFGQNQLPGWTSGSTATNSVFTEPVFATAADQPCYNATFANSWCQQAYRWNLDYVVDTHQDAISYFYTPETNFYARNLGSTADSTYTRGGYLSKIMYGQRAGQVYSTQPAAQVIFSVNGRCNTAPTGCDTSTLTKSTATNWPDVPFDGNCASGAACTSQSPSFWTENMLTGIQTQLLVGSTETNVDAWTLSHSFPATNDTTTASLWLDSIVHSGQDVSGGGSSTAITLPAVTFTGTPLSNRVDVTNGYPPITRRRLTTITTESGETVSVNYSSAVCPTCIPADPSQNTTLAYPDYWTPTGHTSPMLDWFNKYVITNVTVQDPTGGAANDTMVTSYTPVGLPAWRHNDNPLTPAAQRTWDQWRGYQGMVVSLGTAPDPVTNTTYTYFRGMDGDVLPNNGIRHVSIGNSRGDPAITDANQLSGTTYETRVYNGASLVTDTVSDPWTSLTASHALPPGLPAQQAFHTGQARTRVFTPLADGTTRQTETDTAHDAFGRVNSVDDLGDTTTAADDLCTTTSFADNGTAWIYAKVAEVRTVSVKCATTPTLPDNAVSDELTFYDGSTTLGAPPTVGDATMNQKAGSYTGGTPSYITTQQLTFDPYGRDTAVTDADNFTTTTTYTPATGLAPTSVVVKDPLGHSTTTRYDPLRELPVSKTDPAGYVTSEQFDALGRLTAVYKPGQAAPNPPNIKFTYTVSNTAPTAVDTFTLNEDSTYRVAETLYDSLLRIREVQTQTPDNGRSITDTLYNTDGWQSVLTGQYFDPSPVSTTYVQAQAGTVPSSTGYSYDQAGRKTAEISYALGSPTWQTSYTYGGNFTTTVPPAGAAATTTVTDARGRTIDRIQYHAGVTPDYLHAAAGTYDDTKFSFFPNGKMAGQIDPAGNSWSWKYNLLGYQTEATDPDTGTSKTTYDNSGHIIATTDSRAKQTTYKYDNDGRKIGEYDTTTTSTLGPSNQVAAWTWDTVKVGLPTASISYSGGDTYTSTVLAYNTLGMAAATKVTLTGESTALIPVTGYTTSLGYTTTGLLKTQNDPASGSLPAENLTYGYDNHGEVTSLAGSGGASWTYVRAIGYNEFGQAQRYTMGPTTSSVWTDLGYDPQTKNLVDVKVTDSTTSGTVDELAYTFGDSQVSPGAGLLSKTVDKQSNGAVVDTQCYQYDGFTRIAQAWSATDNCAAAPHTGASSTVGGPVAPYWQSWTYDAAGNRKGQVDHAFAGGPTGDTATTYNYPAAGSSTDQPHSLTSTTATGPNAAANTAGYTYDTAGNTLTMSGGALGNQSLTWNDQGKLQSDTTSAGSTSFVYDAGGNVVLRRDPGSTTFYLGDEQIVLNTGTGAVTGTRFYAVAGATVASRTSSGAVSYLVPDRQNTAQLAVNASTQAVTRRQYLPFGQTRGAAPAWAGDKGYVGGNNDAALGLEILGVRMYDPVTGRFLSADPVLEVTDSTQLNGYAYSGNNPVTGSDPTGKMVDPSNGDSYGWTPEQTAPGAPNPYDKVTGKQPKGPDGRFRPNLGSEQGPPPSAKLHGNNLLSKRWTWLYQIMSNVDDSLVKTGITSEPNPEDRYDSSYYEDNDYRMEVRSGWPDRATPDLYEKRIHDIDPGPEDHTDIANKARARMAAEAAQDADVAEGVASADAGMITVDTALKLGGRALIGVAVAYDIYDVYKAPPQERAKTAVKDAASLAGGLAGAEIGAEVGASIGAFGGPVGVVVGGIVGGIAGGIIGSGVAGKATKAVENLFHW